MKCYQCSTSIPDDAAVCPKCGAAQGFSAELVRRAAENDQDAVAELYNRTYGSVYAAVRAMVSDEDTALDILQDSYLKAFRSLDQLEDPSRFRSWVKRIAHNKALDELRKTKVLTFSDLESDDSDDPIEFEDSNETHLPEAVIDRQETTRLMNGILDSLPADQRTVITMFYYEQYSVREIAEELGVSENTVKSRLNYGRKKVETQVRALEKKGTKLYGLAPVPFLMLLLKSQEAQAAGTSAASVLQSVSAGLAAESAAGAAAGAAGTAGSSAGTAAGAAGKAAARTAAKAAGHALRTRILAGAAALAIVGGGGAAVLHHLNEEPPAVTTEAEEEQILPKDFLKDAEALAAEKLASVLTDREYLTMKMEHGELDIPPEYLQLEGLELSKDAVFYEDGGVAQLYLVFEGTVRIDEDWSGRIVNPVPTENPDAAVVFVLDSFPLKFLKEDGSIVYDRDDMEFYKIYRSRAEFESDVAEMFSYVDHIRRDIKLP